MAGVCRPGVLVREQRYVSAAQILERFTARYPAGGLSDNGQPLDAARVASAIAEQLRAGVRLPRIGREIVADAQALPNWSIMPVIGAGGAPEHVMMRSESRTEVGLFSASVGAVGAGGAVVQQRWSRRFREGVEPTLIAYDAETVDLFWPAPDSASIERVDAVTGQTRSAPASSASTPSPARRAGRRARSASCSKPMSAIVCSTRPGGRAACSSRARASAGAGATSSN